MKKGGLHVPWRQGSLCNAATIVQPSQLWNVDYVEYNVRK